MMSSLALLPALLDQVGHVAAHLAATLDPDLVELHHPLDGVAGLRRGVVVHEHVGPVTELLFILLGHAQHLADDHRRDPRRELAEEVELRAPLEGVERLPAQAPRRASSASTLRGVNERLTMRRAMS